MANNFLYIDVIPLFDAEWTGIPTVAAHLTRQFMRILPNNCAFFYEDRIVPETIVSDALIRNTGIFLARDFFYAGTNNKTLDVFDKHGPATAFFPSVKRVRGVFVSEFSLIHDLSTLITPQYHTRENILYHLDNLVDDINTNQLTFCVSQSTLDDVKNYLGVPESNLRLASNGVTWPDDFSARFDGDVAGASIEPYIAVVGTLEPRKNLRTVFEMISRYQSLIHNYRFLIVGKTGWLADNMFDSSEIDANFIRKCVDSGRILFTGFVSEYQKYKIIRCASASLYPSLFEGYGLPVIESLSLGTMCLCSYSSSLPEVGGNATIYFDPLSADDMYGAICKLSALSSGERSTLAKLGRQIASEATWENTAHTIMTHIKPYLFARR